MQRLVFVSQSLLLRNIIFSDTLILYTNLLLKFYFTPDILTFTFFLQNNNSLIINLSFCI